MLVDFDVFGVFLLTIDILARSDSFNLKKRPNDGLVSNKHAAFRFKNVN